MDVSIDQGGCAETIRPTNYENPTFVVDGYINYVKGANLGGFVKVAEAMLAYGVV